MSSVIAIVKSIVGQVIALTPEGAQRLLIEGDRLFKGEQLVTGPQSMVSLELTDGRIVDLGRDSQWSSAELEAQTPDAQQSASLSAAELQQAIAAGVDPTQEFAPTAAGPAGTGGAGGAVGGGHSFVLLEATAEQLDPTVGFATQGLDFSADALTEDLGTGTQDNAATVGNTGSAGSDTVAVDTSAPLAPSPTLSDDTGTSNADRITKDGTLSVGGIEPGSTVAYSTDGTTWTNSFTPTEGSNTVYVRQTDSAGNVSPSSPALTFTYDTSAPTVQVEIAAAALKAGETSGVTFTFSEPPEGFALGDLSSAQGTFSNLQATGNPRVWTATFTPTADIENTATVTVSAGSYTDTAGNAGAAGSDTVAVDTSAPLAPSVTLSTDTGTSNADRITKDGTLSVGGIEPGATLAYSTDGTTWTNSFTPTEGSNTVYVRQTDSAGNVSPASPALTFTYDTSAPTVQVEIAAAALKAGETSGVTFTFSEPPEGFALGDLSSAQGTFSNLQATGNPRVWTATFTPTADIENTATVTVSAGSYTDTAGNAGSAGSDTVAVDTSATAAPTVTISTDSNDDGTLSSSELGADTSAAVSIGLPAGAVAGDTLTVTDGTTPQTFVLTDAQIAAGAVVTSFARPADGQPLNVSATVTDQAGNTSAPGSDSATVGDTTATAAPTVTISTDANNDAVLSSSELGSATSVAVSIGLPAGAVAGDTLTVTDGTTPQTFVLTPAQVLAGSVATSFARPADGQPLNVSATVTDQAGNTSAPGSDSAIVGDTTATAAPTVTISTDANNDAVLSNSELGSATSVAVSIGLPAGAIAGDSLTVSDGSGTPQTFVLTDAQIAAGAVITSFARPADGQPLNVSASVTDQAGNTSAPGSDSASVGDTTAPTVSIGAIAGNDVVDDSEDNSVTIAGTTSGVENGQLVSVMIDGVAVGTATVTNNAWSLSGVDLSGYADGQTYSVTADVSDAAGNPAVQAERDIATTDTTAPTVSIGVIAGNDVVDDSEDNSVTIAGTTSGVENGQLVSVMIDGVAVGTATVTNNVWSLSGVDLSGYADGQTYSVTADVSDAAGNPAVQAARDIATTDTTATAAPVVTISTDANNDAVLSSSELGAATSVAVTISLPAGAVAGDTLTVTDGTTPQTFVLTPAQVLAGSVATSFARPVDGQPLNVSATVTDQAGNTSAPGSDSATVGDTTATAAPTVTISTDTNNDAVLSSSELGSATSVAVSIGLPAGAVAGDTLTVTDGTTPQTFVLTPAQVLAGSVATSFARPADGQPLNVSATVTDQAGNTSAPGSDSAIVGDTTATAAPTVTISTDANNDAVLSNSELGSATSVAVSIGLPAGAIAGDSLTVSDGSGTPQTFVLTDAQIAAGAVITSFARPADGQPLNVSASVTDQAGNTSAPGSDSASVGDTTAPTVSIGAIAGNDVVDDSEDNSVTIAGTTSGVENGQLVSVMIDGVAVGTAAVTNNAWSLSGVDLSGYADGQTYSVTADVSDAAGNPAVQAERDISTTDTTAPTVSIGAIAGNDVVDDSEDNSVTIAGTTSGVENGQLVSVMIDGVAVGTATVSNNAWSLSGVDLSGYADGQTYSVTADVSDAAGNPAVQAERDISTTDTSAPTVSIGAIAGNDVVDDSEDNSVTIAGTTSGVENGQLVSVMIDGVAVGTATVSNNAWSLSGVDLSGYADGQTYSVTADVSDAAGNPAVQAERDISTTDTTAPTVSIGAIAGNDVVDDSEDNSVTINGTTSGVENGQLVSVMIDGVAVGTATVTNNTWSLSGVDLSGYADGQTYSVTADVSDAAGNPAVQAERDISTTDTSAPTVTASQTFNYAENQVAGSTLGTVAASDSVGVTGYRFSNDTQVSADGFFAISNSGAITLTAAGAAAGAATNDFETGANSFTVQVVALDAAGNSSPVTNVTLNLTNLNEAPAGTDNTFSINEDSSKVFAASDFGFSDVDAGDSLQAVRIDALPGAGSLTLGGVAVSAGQVISLAQLGSLTFTPAANANGNNYASLSFSVQDASGAFSPAPNTLTLNVTPVNDTPVATATSATAVEDGAAITGQLAASDLDQDAMLTFSLNAAAPAGFSLDSTTGSWTFDPSNAAYQALAAGEERQINVPFSVTDEHGAASQSVLNLTITGTNDAPLMQASLGNVAGVITKPQTQANHSFASAIGLDGSFVQVANADVLNSTTTPFVSINSIGNGAADYYVFTVTQAGSTAVFDIDHARAADGSGLDSVIHLWDANGTRLTYNDDAAITSGAGGSAHDYDAYLSYTFAQPGTYYISVGSYLAGTDPFNPNNSISAGLGYQLQVSLTNALTGATGSLTERVDGSANENSGNLTSSGVLTFSDVDLSDTHTVNAILQSASDSLNGTTAARGSFTPVISDPASGDGAGEISWTYTVAAGALDDLAAGQALTLVYRVSVTDNHGAQSYRDVTISLTGTNDAPVVGTGSAIVSEEGLTGANADSLGSTDTTNSLTVTGNISISDVDAGSSFIVTLGAPSTALTSGGQSVQWSGSGTNLLTGSAGGKTIVTIGIDNQGNYSVALAGPLDHAGTSSEDLRSFGVTVNVNDGSTTTSNTLTINVEDDSPTLGTPTGVELMTAAGTIATGNLGLSIGADATGSEVQFSSISGSVDATGNILASTYDQNGTLISSSTYLTYQDSKLHYVNAADGSLTAITSDGTAVFKVSANPVTGEYQVTNFKTLDSAIASISNFNISGGNSGVFQLGAGSHFEMVATATTNGIVSTVNTSANFFGVAAGQSIDAEDVLSFTLRDVDTQAATTMTSMSFKTDKLGNGETLTWTAYAADGSSLGNGTVAGQNGSDASFTVSTSLLNGHAFSSISLGASSGTSYKLMINGISGHASAYDQSIKLGVAGVDGDGDSTTIKSLNIAFDGGFTSSESITGTSSNDAINQATSTTSKLISTLGGNDYVEAGAGNDFIYLGDSGNNNHPVTGLAVTRADVSATNLLNLDDSALLLSDSTLSLTARMTSASSSQPANQWADLGHAGSGNDHVFGEAGVDLIYGGVGSDVLYGGAGVDGLRGGSGNDILVGGTGDDVMRGDAGKDSFVWRAGDTGNDVIMDFSAAQGDRIDLSDLLPDNASNDILSYLQVNTATSTLQVSTTGNFAGGADVTIQLQGVDLTTYGASSAQIVNSLIAGADPLVKVDQN